MALTAVRSTHPAPLAGRPHRADPVRGSDPTVDDEMVRWDRQDGSSRRRWLVPVCIGGVLLIGWLDHAVGLSLTLAPFYLVPVAAIGWHRGRAAGIALAALSTMCSLAGDLSHTGTIGTLAPYWNAAARFPVFVFVVLLLVRVREGMEQQHQTAALDREAAQAMRAANAMKTTFLNAAAHDLRSPVTALLGSALTLQQMGEELGPNARGDLVNSMVRSGRSLERLLNELLDLERLQSTEARAARESVFLPALVDRAMAEAGFGERTPVTIDVQPTHARLDRVMVERLLANLLVNARRHLAPGTPVWVRIHRRDGEVAISVEDAGPGVPNHLRASIFEPFKRGGEGGDGMGIGLSLVARFAELHGGRAWVEDRPGGGASFRVSLPDDSEAAAG
jgi:signal transduction histidine kinase